MLIKVLLIVAVVFVAVASLALWKIGPRNVIGMIRYDRRQEGTLRVGDEAPDLALTALDGSTRVTLREHQGTKPLVLVFGSYT
jgi:hypothetical protein